MSQTARTTPYLIDASQYPPEKTHDFGDLGFMIHTAFESVVTLTNNDRTVEWTQPSNVSWIPLETKARLHSGKWTIEFHIESMKNRQIGVGFLLDWNVGPDWGFFGYLGSSSSAWAYDPSTGDIVTNTDSILGDLPKIKDDNGLIVLELNLPKDSTGDFTFIVNGIRTPRQKLSNSGAVVIPAVCLLSQGQKVTIENLKHWDESNVV